MSNTEHPLTGADRILLESIKRDFLHLCKQFSVMGNQTKMVARILSHPSFKNSGAREAFQKILDQHFEMGEQLKELGAGLDDMGGKSVMGATGFPTKARMKNGPAPKGKKANPSEAPTKPTRKKSDESK